MRSGHLELFRGYEVILVLFFDTRSFVRVQRFAVPRWADLWCRGVRLLSCKQCAATDGGNLSPLQAWCPDLCLFLLLCLIFTSLSRLFLPPLAVRSIMPTTEKAGFRLITLSEGAGKSSKPPASTCHSLHLTLFSQFILYYNFISHSRNEITQTDRCSLSLFTLFH